jgi:hypothetical protein
MSEVVLQLDSAMPFEKMIAILAPYIKKAEVKKKKEAPYKIWDGKMDCLMHPWKVDRITPLQREELYDRQGLS